MKTLTLTLAFALLAFQARAQQPTAADPQDTAIRQMIDSFKVAFDKADAATIAAMHAEDAQVIGPDGNAVKGRDAIQKQFETYFGENPGASLELEVASLKFLTPEVAQEEGVAKVKRADEEEPRSNRYSVLYVKKDGKWLQQEVRDYPQATAEEAAGMPEAEESLTFDNPLSQLDWLIGEWVDESPNQIISHRCRYILGGKYIVREYSTSYNQEETVNGVHVIGYDAQTGLIKSWGFDAEGSHGKAFWTRDGNRWVIKMEGVLGDGRTVSATQVLDQVNNDTLRMVSLERTLGDTMAPDRDEVILVRKPPAPAGIDEAAPAEVEPAAEPAPSTTPAQQAAPAPATNP